MKLSTPSRFGLAALALAASSVAFADAPSIYTQGFENLATSGWLLTNNSAPAGLAWFQGVPESLSAQAGATDSFAMATYNSALNGTGSIDNWLISPEIALNGATELSFWARTEDTAGYADQIKVYFSAGSASNTASFTTLLSSVAASTGGWTQYSLALPNAASGRIAFDYAVADANNANVIAIDSVSITAAVPEPSSYALMGLGLCAVAFARRKVRAQ
ncbi:PEP-CTERM sorting domain-containing protein [Paucibacter sp. B2R-40]|uniref:choice-of-anchor J family PEP-CTERM protein n=1 Tax=Paucibacter sp. B2R-40 TaxID=2893554 RepID=UPI0021E3B8BE|nr:PEP-CTERM sorting domain-containing protein [Paucibacter sp. B2R-40]MCV2353678.1 PEP-CTERM sorting domain-containing protein [Paucibacter sp. B2R-40]